jgi:GTP-binding protein Era
MPSTKAADDLGGMGGADVRSGFVALVGRPNSGKSTLVNALVGSKVAIVSDKPQTTRHRLRAVVDSDDAQVVIVDTPGLHKPIDALGEELNRSALMALHDVDVACLVVDSTKPVGAGDKWVAAHVAASPAGKVLVMTKADLPCAMPMDRRIESAGKLCDFDDVVVLSALEGFNLQGFMSAVIALLPDGPRYFPRDMSTDQPIEVMLAEFIREKVLIATRDEIPHSVGVAIESVTGNPSRGATTIVATIYVERDSQKGIIIGSGGDMVRTIGTQAREDLERLLGRKVFLDLNVKVKKDWRADATQIRRFGYGEGL